MLYLHYKFRFGTIDLRIKSADTYDYRYGEFIARYMLFVLVTIVFIGNDLVYSKRPCFLLTILGCIYEGGLYAALSEKDVVLDLFPNYFWLFEILKIIHFCFVFIFLLTAGVGAILGKVEDKGQETEKNKLLGEVAQKQKIISERIHEINEDRLKNEMKDSSPGVDSDHSED